MNEARPFDLAAQSGGSGTIAGFSAASVAWLQEARSSADADAEYRTALLERSSEALSKVNGVNLDEEMTVLLELERSYQASSKLVTMIDSMFDSAADGGGINAMKSTFISTRAISEATRLSMVKMQSKLLVAQKEVATGRLADVGKSLGHQAGQTVSLRQEHLRRRPSSTATRRWRPVWS